MDAKASSRLLSLREQLVLSILWFALNIPSAALLPIVIPTQILLFVTPGQIGDAQQVTFLSWFTALAAAVSLFVPPLIGILSDYTPGRFGRRRPYIVGGTLIVLVSVPMLIEARNILILLIGLGVMQVGLNVITAGYQSLAPDLVPVEQRGAASGYIGGMTILGNVVSLLLAAWLFGQVSLQSITGTMIQRGVILYYDSAGIILLIGVLITVLGVHEVPFSLKSSSATQEQAKIEFRLRDWFVQNWMKPWQSYNFTLVFLTRTSVMMGLTLFMTFIEYYFAQVAHATNFVQETATVAVLALLGAVLSAFWLGVFSDYTKRAPLVSISTVFMGLAAFAFVIFPGGFPLWPLGILFGLGYGAYMSVDWALSIDALPSMNAVGKDMGIWNASATLPSIIAPLIGSLIIAVVQPYTSTVVGYRLIFAAATFFLIIAAVFVLLVREQQTPGVKSTRRRVGLGWKLAFQTRAGRAQGFLLFWIFWEHLMHALWRIQPIPQAPHHLLEVRFTRYTGRPITLPDGTHIEKNDSIVELHFRNQAFLDMTERVDTWKYMHAITENLSALASWMQHPDFPSNAQAIYGVTLLYRGAPRLGFTLRRQPVTLHARLERFFMMGLLVLYHRKGGARLLQGTTYGTYPQEAWMSRAELLKRYATPSSSSAGE